jgi:hypothetical protein
LKKEKPNVVATLPKNSLISVEVLAFYLNCNTDSLKRWIQKSGVKYRSVNGKWLIDVDTLLD